MRPTSDAPRPSPAEVGSTLPENPDTSGDGALDENLHFGRAWHRFHSCYRPMPGRVLDAGCGTGASTLALARLNGTARVVGVDASGAAVAIAQRRALAQGLGAQVDFRRLDLTHPLPAELGRFDFIVCRGVLGHAADPPLVLEHLAQALEPEGLLLATLPSRHGRVAANALRRAVTAVVEPGTGLESLTATGLSLLDALRPDHPVRVRLTQNANPADSHATTPSLSRTVVDALDGSRAWNLDEAASLLEQAGLTFLYAATPWHWRGDRVFDAGPAASPFRDHLAELGPAPMSLLIDALDPEALGDEYVLYACARDQVPATPHWPRTRLADPSTFDRLVPHRTGLAHPATDLPQGTASQGRALYRTVAGHLIELDRMSVLRLEACDGRVSCGDIDRRLAPRSRSSDNDAVRQECWINLADCGLLLLREPD